MIYEGKDINVKILTSDTSNKLEEKIENLLNDELKEKQIIDIKYSVYNKIYYSALIIYQK